MTSSTNDQLRRRSCLVVPGSSQRMLEKAAGGTGADEIVIDLEDAVSLAQKDGARELLGPAAEGIAAGGARAAVRVNAPGAPWCHRDVEAACAAPTLASIVVPKVESAGDLAFVERLLDGVEAASGRELPLRVQVLIETAAGLANLGEIAAASARVEGLILGYADLAASLGRDRGDLDSWRGIQEGVVVAARANALQAIDGPYFGLDDEAGLRAAAGRAAALGFDGKWAIHPAQVGPINEAFTPSAEELARARAVLAALREAEADGGAGAVRVDGQMVDEAMAVAARRVVARAGEAD